MVILLASTFIDSTVVVHFSATRNALGAVVVCHVGLGANDWLNALLTTFVVKLDNAVHVAVIGNTQCWLAIFYSLSNQLIEARCSVEHGVFGMNVEVCK